MRLKLLYHLDVTKYFEKKSGILKKHVDKKG